MGSVAAYVRSRGLRFGLYTAQREFTCQQRPGSWRFEDIDIDTYCALGIEYVKTDACSGRGNPVGNDTWVHFRAGIERCVAGGGAPIVLSVESCGDASCGAWIGGLANLWRTTGDIQATFASVLSNLDNNDRMAAFAGPGHWNDPDMLQVGDAGLSLDEARSHFAAWAVVAAPLLISNDLVSGIDNETLAILSAPEVIAVDQDALGVQGVRVSPAAPLGAECWARPLADGSVAALLLNRGAAAADVTCSWAEIGLKNPSGAASVRDLWLRSDLGSFTGGFTATALRSHASMLIKVAQA
jgi:alpha-galactosidase